jgi:hypothetical protein
LALGNFTKSIVASTFALVVLYATTLFMIETRSQQYLGLVAIVFETKENCCLYRRI